MDDEISEGCDLTFYPMDLNVHDVLKIELNQDKSPESLQKVGVKTRRKQKTKKRAKKPQKLIQETVVVYSSTDSEPDLISESNLSIDGLRNARVDKIIRADPGCLRKRNRWSEITFNEMREYIIHNPTDSFGAVTKIEFYLETMEKLDFHLLKSVCCICSIIKKLILLYEDFVYGSDWTDMSVFPQRVKELFDDMDGVILFSASSQYFDFKSLDAETGFYKWYVYDRLFYALEDLAEEITLQISREDVKPEIVKSFWIHLRKLDRYKRDEVKDCACGKCDNLAE